MQKKISGYLKNFDLFEKPVQLMIKKQDAHRTLLGSLLTIFLLALLSTLLMSSLLDLFNKVNPSTLISEIYHVNPDKVTLRPENFTLQFGIQGADYNTYIDESIFIVNATFTTKEVKQINGKQETVWKSVPIPLTLCSNDSIKQQVLSDYFKQQDQTTNFCINWNEIDELALAGDFNSPVFKVIQIYFYTCSDNTRRSNGPQCKSKAEIKDRMTNNFFSMQLSSVSVDVINPDIPFAPLGENTYTTISSETFKELNYFYQPTTVVTDLGLITTDYIKQNALRYVETRELMNLNAAENFAQVTFKLKNVESYQKRSYPKLQTILAQIGGLWNVLFIVTKFLQYPISTLSYKLSIINSLFNFESRQDYEQDNLQKLNQTAQKNGQSPEQAISGSPSFKNAQQIHRRLQSLKFKNDQLNLIQDDEKSLKEKIKNQLQESLKQFFDIAQKKMRLTCAEYLTQFKCASDKIKKRQYDFSVERMEKSIDVLYIIKKIQEIDKLKMILLSSSQLKIFDYLPKPCIAVDPDQTQFNQYFSILGPSKSNIQKAKEAQSAFKDILRNLQEPINRQLINCMDPHILELLKMQITSDQLNTLQNDQIILSTKGQQEQVNLISGDCSRLLPNEYDFFNEIQEQKILEVKNIDTK